MNLELVEWEAQGGNNMKIPEMKSKMKELNKPITISEVSFLISVAVTESLRNIGEVLGKMIPNFDSNEYSRFIAEETMKGVPEEVLKEIQEELHGKEN